jgi:hypothetical protein
LVYMYKCINKEHKFWSKKMVITIQIIKFNMDKNE